MYESGENQPLPSQLQNYNQTAFIKEQISNRRYFKKLLNFTLLALVAASGYLLFKRPASVSLDNAFLALMIIWLGLLPSLEYLLNRHRSPMPFFPMVGLFYATSFGLPTFASEQEASCRWSLANVSSTALILVILALIGMNAAFFISKSSLWKHVSPIRLPGPYALGRLRTLLWLFLGAHLAYLYVPSVRGIPSLGQLLDPIGYVAYGMFYIIYSRGKLPVIQTWLLFGICVPLEIIPRFASGSLAQIMLLGLFMVIVILHESKRIPFVFISITLVFFLIFNSVKGEYRSLVWFGGKNSNLSPIEKVQLFIDVAIKHYQTPSAQSQQKGSQDSVVSRTAHILLFSNVIEDTPAIVPYWRGETYLPLLTSYIARALLPDKPIENTGNKFGRRYNYLGSNDFTTSYNLPWLVELYANFGTWGVLLGMPFFGLLLAFLEQKFNHPEMTSLEFVIGNTVLFGLVYQESNFSLMTGSIVNLSLALYVLFKFFLGGRSRRIA